MRRRGIREEVYTLVNAALPALSRGLDGQVANRLTIRQLMEEFEQSGEEDAIGLSTPFIVYDWLKESRVEGGQYPATVDVREWQLNLYYCTSLRYPALKPVDEYLEELELSCEALRSAFRAHTGPRFQCHKEAVIDTSSMNLANQIFIQYNQPMVAAVVSVWLVGAG